MADRNKLQWGNSVANISSDNSSTTIFCICQPRKNLRDCADTHACMSFDSLRPCQQFFSHVGAGLPGLNQY